MTPEKEAELVEKMAAEICYAGFVAPIDYGGPTRYWKGVVEAKKEAYRREARAALAIAAPILRDEALDEAKIAVEREYLTDPDDYDDGDIAYDKGVRYCAAAIDSLKTQGYA